MEKNQFNGMYVIKIIFYRIYEDLGMSKISLLSLHHTRDNIYIDFEVLDNNLVYNGLYGSKAILDIFETNNFAIKNSFTVKSWLTAPPCERK